MPDQYYTFSAFHAQSKFVVGVVQGRVELPSKEDMLADTAAWQEKEDTVGDDSAHFDQWLDDRHHNILTYRDQTAVSSVSGAPSLTFGMPWVKMYTDDKVAYLSWCKAEYEDQQKAQQ